MGSIMKFDKEKVLKHKFWILLLVTLPLTLGAIFLLVTSVAGDIEATRKKIEADYKKVGQRIEIKTPTDIAEARQAADIEKEKEKIVHAKAYEKQEDLFVWPELVESQFNFRSGLFAQKIQVYKKGELPADSIKNDRYVQGLVTGKGAGYIEVQTGDKKVVKLLRSQNVLHNNTDGEEKEVPFEGIQVGNKVAAYFNRGKYYNDDLTDQELATYTRLEVYLSQIDPLLAQVDPMRADGKGVVQLKMPPGLWFYKKGDLPPPKPFQRFINYLDQGWENAGGDISEEAWLAQEDIWVQNEIYRLIRLANDSVSKLENVNKNDTGDNKETLHTFKNPFWEIGFKFTGPNKLTMAIKNLQNRRQTLDVKFKVRFTKNMKMEPEDLVIGGEPLGPRGTKEADRIIVHEFKDNNPARKGIYSVDQVLTWETAAVKRIDQVSLGSLAPDEFSHSHRTFSEDQRPYKTKDKPPEPVDPIAAQRLLVRPQYPKGKDPGGNDMTKHNLIRNRYAEVTPQSRRIPVSVVLIVDQDHIDRVLNAFSNSKLRFVTTQMLLNRFPGSLRPQLPVLNQTGTGQNLRRFDGPNGPFSQQVLPPIAGGSNELETNWEMVIYGMVTLYERFPPPVLSTLTPEAK